MSNLRSPLDRANRSIAEQHPDFPAIEIGGYRIGPCVHGGWWIDNLVARAKEQGGKS